MNKKYVALFAVIALAIMPAFAFGQSIVDPAGNPFGYLNPATGEAVASAPVSDLPVTIMQLVSWFAWFISLVSVVMGLYSGFLFITARGEAAQLSTARKTLMYAIIGIAVAVFSFSIITVTKMFFL